MVNQVVALVIITIILVVGSFLLSFYVTTELELKMARQNTHYFSF